jgi:hypothetical protein
VRRRAARLPEPVAERLHREMRAAAASPGHAVPGAAPDRRLGRAEVAAEVARWGEVARATGVRPD